MNACTRDGHPSVPVRIRNTVLMYGDATSILKTRDYVAQFGIVASFAPAATKGPESRAVPGLHNSMETDLDFHAYLMIHDSTGRSIATGE